jgi:CRP/FNR family transcriptional regulator, anaerobic regulatory protein
MSIVPIYRQDLRHPQAEVCASCGVRQFALFGVLDDAGLDRIHAHIASVDVAPDRPVFSRGERGAAVYTVRSGVVRFERVTERGDRRIVRLAGRGDLIGPEVLLQRPYADDAVACTAVQLCRIPRTLVDELGQGETALMRELMQRWQRALDDAEAWLADLATGPARRRVLRLMVKLGEHADASGLTWLPRREEIGDMLDMTIETASRLISQLRREGVLELVGARGVRLHMAALLQAVRREDAL